MTKFTGLAIAIIILASLTGPLPSAQAQDNPVILELGGEGATSWNIANIVPGDSGIKTLTLHNAGSEDGLVSLWVSDIISSEGTNPESETGDTGEPGELDQYLRLDISCPGLDSNISLPTTIDNFPQSASDPDYIKISPLDGGETITLDWQWQLPVETGNEVQGDSLSFTINYMLEEIPAVDVGGGGVSAYYLRVDLWGEKSKTRVTSAGRVRSDLEALSVDEMLTIYITKGVLAQTENGRRLREIEVWPMAQPPPLPENSCIIGVAYDFSPDGATFDAPIEFLITYDPEELPENVSSLFIAAYDEEQGWRQLAPISGFIAAVGTATAEVSHFTIFAVIATVGPPAPAAFTVSKLIISPAEVDIGQSVTSSVIVTNTGGETGSYKVTFKIDGVVEATRAVTLSAGATFLLTFTTAKDVAGSYAIDVNGLSGSFTVKEKPAPPPTPAPTPPSMPAKPFNWPLVGGITGVVLTGLGVFFWIRRRADKEKIW